MVSDDRAARFEAEIQRRIDLYLEHRRDMAPDGPGLDAEDRRALLPEAGTYAELEERFGGGT